VKNKPVRLSRSSRKTERGAGQFLARLVVRAAPFALLMSLVLGLGINGLLNAQTSSVGSVVGQVLDTSQAGIPGAKVTVINVGTNAERSTNTSSSGEFSMPNLPPGQYRIRIEKAGFETAVVQPFDLNINEIANKLCRSKSARPLKRLK
jgi:hypothetical protein